MKVILEEDVRGKGHKGQVIDVANGYGTFLINSKKAIPANDSNMKKWKRNQDEIALQDNLRRKEANIFKNDLEKQSWVFKVKSNGGKIFGSVTDTDLANEIGRVYPSMGITKKDVKVPKISTVGLYEASVVIYKDIVARLSVDVQSE